MRDALYRGTGAAPCGTARVCAAFFEYVSTGAPGDAVRVVAVHTLWRAQCAMRSDSLPREI
eukprot:NODE_8890_length_363_cov_177.142857.p5 GENE.NODE_8890_length_363_cov_177.142857~~NODE_8890_length_363_cov_177.142857.p5  ORF type:complete len:61 (-),score=2.24 NODE_8890_length_363_cov_177.142857:10-192(-)